MTDNKLEHRLDDLEIKVAYAEQLLEALNRSVTEQSAALARVEGIMAAVAGRIHEIDSGHQGPILDAKPPHY